MSYNQTTSGDDEPKRKHIGRPKFHIERIKAEAKGDDKPVEAPPISRSDLSGDQVIVYDKVIDWLGDANKRQYLKFGGLAGTGKTTLISVLASELEKSDHTVAFGAFTGKAANVLSKKLKAAKIKVSCNTLHSLMYGSVLHDHKAAGTECPTKKAGSKCPRFGRIEKWAKKPSIEAGLVIVDEASMINGDMWDDLLSFGVPVLAVGDHGQLPPIGRDSVNLMQTPDLVLEKIHRQAEGNPILAFAHFIRQGGNPWRFNPSDDRVMFGKTFVDVVDELIITLNAAATAFALAEGSMADKLLAQLMGAMAVIVGKNATRTKVNQIFRARRGFSGPVPDPDDIVIALKNFKPVFNGMRGVFEGATDNYTANEFGMFEGKVLFPDDGFRVVGGINAHQFGREKTFEHPRDIKGPDPTTGMPTTAETWADTGLLLDYGYALTCHKAQGSQFSEVVVCAYDTFGSADDRKRWLYTASTRAVDRLIVVR